eukprot:4585847-Amphidinium_carterae.1
MPAGRVRLPELDAAERSCSSWNSRVRVCSSPRKEATSQQWQVLLPAFRFDVCVAQESRCVLQPCWSKAPQGTALRVCVRGRLHQPTMALDEDRKQGEK